MAYYSERLTPNGWVSQLTPARPLTRTADGQIAPLRRVQQVQTDWSHLSLGAMRARVDAQEAHAARLADEARCEADGFITVHPARDMIVTGLE